MGSPIQRSVPITSAGSVALTLRNVLVAASKCSLGILPVKQVVDLVPLANRRTIEPVVFPRKTSEQEVIVDSSCMGDAVKGH